MLYNYELLDLKYLSKKEMDNLIVKYRETKDNNLLEEIIKQNYKFIYKTMESCNKLENREYLNDDLIQEGILGLIHAVKNYDPNRDNKFLSYAGWYIKEYMYRYLYKNFSYTMPYNLGRYHKKYLVYVKEHEGCSVEEISEVIGLEEKYIKYFSRISNRIAFNQYNEEKYSIIDENDEYDRLEDRMMNDYIINIIDKNTTDYQMLILRKRYGLDGEEPKSCEKVAKEVDSTKTSVWGTEKRTIRKIKKVFKTNKINL